MRIGRNRTLRRRSGAAAVELALLAPMLAFVALIGTDYSRLFFSYATLIDCARAGAVYSATHSGATAAAIQAVALADATNLSPTPTVASTSWTDVSGVSYVQVTVSYTFQTIVVNPSIPSSTNLSQSVVMMSNPP